MSEPLNKEEKKKLADYFYKAEEDRWSSVTTAYYQPRGAPGRLSEELLDQWHRKHETGVKHPQDRHRILVKILFDQRSYSVKCFLTEHGAENYIEVLQQHDIEAEIVKSALPITF